MSDSVIKLREVFLGRLQFWIVVAICCCASLNGFSQLVYLTDTRSVSGFANFQNTISTPPLYVTSYTPFSGSNTPSAPFADFHGSATGTATLVEAISNSTTGQLTPYSTASATESAQQTSFLHSQELYFNSQEFGSSSPPSYAWFAQGSSYLQVTFSVSAPVPYSLTCTGTGDPVGTGFSYNLSSSSQGVLINGTLADLLRNYGSPNIFSGTFNPGNVYTLTLESGSGTTGPFPDGGGFIADLVVPEPSMTTFAGFAFLIFLLRGKRAIRG